MSEKKANKKFSLKDFHITQYITWDELERVMGKRLKNRFLNWMFGQTSSIEGVYPWDLELFLNGYNKGLINKNIKVYD